MNETRVLKGVTSIHIEPRYTRQKVRRNPTGLWDYLVGEQYEWVDVPSLSLLYVDGCLIGYLHAYAPGQSRAVQAHLAATRGGKVDLQLECHRTSSGFFVDTIKIV